ncbi:MAG: aminomethyl-transferring glycine dehydrogenase subunit GcvPB [Thermoplasmata archaeon]|nr:aminomethyl-transferring glycine dehydrogenase subunit GcvPB [Thermoplasmata archaeon]
MARYSEETVFEIGADTTVIPASDLVPKGLGRELRLPDLTEAEVVRHFVRLSQMNYCVDTGFYPLGSCTMKYTPRALEASAALPGFADLHPEQPQSTVQGALALMWELERMLAEIGGMRAVTLQPAAGSHGEYTGMLLVRAYHASRGDGRDQVLVPDTAHGTNPATAAMAGYEVVEVPSNDAGRVDLEALGSAVSDRTAAIMLTNPNTLGIFEEDVRTIAKTVHSAGGLLYYDGANLNAIMGYTKPGAMGFDVVHFNLHKTFATPHGGGGPGAGPVGVVERLEPFLPVPRIAREGGRFSLDSERPQTIGKVQSFYGNFLVLVRAYAYIRMQGAGLKGVSERAVLNANYLAARLSRVLPMPFGPLRKHEFVLSGEPLKEKGVRALDVAKRLGDYGFHAPTTYFPLLVPEALMIEPTETEDKATLDAFAEAIETIVNEDPELLHGAPHNVAPRVDEVKAAKMMALTWDLAMAE